MIESGVEQLKNAPSEETLIDAGPKSKESVFLEFVGLISKKFGDDLPFKAIHEFTHESVFKRYEDVFLLNEGGEKLNGLFLFSRVHTFKEYYGAGLIEEEFTEYFLLENGEVVVTNTVIETIYYGDRIDRLIYRKLKDNQDIKNININNAIENIFKILKKSLFDLDSEEKKELNEPRDSISNEDPLSFSIDYDEIPF